MNDMDLLQVILVIFSLMCTLAGMAYRLGKDVQKMRCNTRRFKRNRRSRKH